jgi:hypothetical protein
MIFNDENIYLLEILTNFLLPEVESDEFVDEFAEVGDRAAHIDNKL